LLIDNVQSGVNSALSIRDSFKVKNKWHDLGIPEHVDIRCSLHVGDVVLKIFSNPILNKGRLDAIGSNIDLTARIEPVTVAGRIWATEQIISLLGDERPPNVENDPIGKRELAKGWGIRNLYDIRRHGDEKINIEDIPKLDRKIKLVEASEIANKPAIEKTLVIICGPSAVGKDAIASRLRGRLDILGIEATFPLKYTTRPQRLTEDIPIDGRWFEPSSQYEFLDEVEFKDRPNIVGVYHKYGFQYGFSSDSLASDQSNMKFQICIYGDLDSLADFRKKVEDNFNRKVFVVLLQSPKEDLMPRLDTRPGMTGEVIRLRKPEMIRYLARVQRMSLGGDHIVMDNSNIDNPDDITEMIMRDILERIGYINKQAI